MDAIDIVLQHRIVPVLALDDPALVEVVSDALVSGGLGLVEVTFRSPRAADVLRQLAGCPDLLVGAGTIVRPSQVTVALEAGARFVVSPGLSAEVVRECQRLGVPIIPGVATPSEIMAAIGLGLTLVKFFPAEQLGGVPMLKALAPVFPDMRFLPTGGIGPGNVNEYLSVESVVAVGGSWMFEKNAVAAGDTARLQELVHTARAAVDGTRTSEGESHARTS